jgi:hypothetical protein
MYALTVSICLRRRRRSRTIFRIVHVYQRTIYPEPLSDESIVKWKSREKTERVPFIIYADFESCLVPVHDDSGGLDEHILSGFCAYTVSSDPEFETGPVTYSGRNCMKAFYDHLASEQHRIASILKDYHEMLEKSRNVSIKRAHA